jgi:hypothetical protein
VFVYFIADLFPILGGRGIIRESSKFRILKLLEK